MGVDRQAGKKGGNVVINTTGIPLRNGVPCPHPGCLRHATHPCEGCGRVGGRAWSVPAYCEEEVRRQGHDVGVPEGLVRVAWVRELWGNENVVEED
jgi:hypothetical protein